MAICIIPARGGSKRIPRKNIKPFCGQPMLAWALAAARNSGLFSRIIVSTDDREIAQIATALGAEAPFSRPDTLSDDHTSSMAVIAHAVGELGLDQTTAVCALYPTAPFVTPADLQGAQSLLDQGDFVMSVTSFAFPIQRASLIGEDGALSMIDHDAFFTRSQDLPEAVHDAGAFYWAHAGYWATMSTPYDGRVMPFKLPRARVQDIDTAEDWDRAEAMFKALGLDQS